MKIISANVNGIRAAEKKGFFSWLKKVDADIVCIQETKAQEDQLHPEIYYPENYHCHYFDAEKKGYSGVAIFSKIKPLKVIRGFGNDLTDMDAEGRYIQADFDINGTALSVASIYVPSGSSKEERQQIKFSFMDRYTPVLKSMRRKRREYIICGDWNIVHKEIDIKNWKSNQKNSGCLPEERAWLDKLFGPLGYVDAFGNYCRTREYPSDKWMVSRFCGFDRSREGRRGDQGRRDHTRVSDGDRAGDCRCDGRGAVRRIPDGRREGHCR